MSREQMEEALDSAGCIRHLAIIIILLVVMMMTKIMVMMMTTVMMINVFFYVKDPLLWLAQVTAEVPMALCTTIMWLMIFL